MQTKKVKPKQSLPSPAINNLPQKIIRNQCLQSLEVYFIDETGAVASHWLMPKEMLKIPSEGVTPQLRLLRERRMIQIRDI